MEFINIMSSEGRDYLPKTIETIDKDNHITIFYQHSSDNDIVGIGLTPEEFRQSSVLIFNKKIYQEVQLNAQWHYSYILKNAKTDNNSIIIAEDDIQFSKNFNQYFDEIKKDLPERYILALYSPYPHFSSQLEIIEQEVEAFYGTQLMIYDTQTAFELSEHISENLGKEPYDLAIKTFVKKTNIPFLRTTFSLCEHIGEVSTGLGGGHKAGRFIDDYIK